MNGHFPHSTTVPAVVFLHGGGLSRQMWQPQLDSLAEFTCLAPDLPEHGARRGCGPAFTLAGAADEVAALIREQVPGGQAHLVGLSLGGAVALTLLSRHPEVAASALVSGTAARLSPFLGRLSIASLGLLRFYSADRIAELTARQQGIPARYRPQFLADLRSSATPEFTRRQIEALMTMQLPDRIDVPLLVCVGEHETLPAKQAAQTLARRYPTAQLAVAPGVGHVWNLQAPELFTSTVRAWVLGQPLPGPLRTLVREGA